jgi:hypothetical protein
MQLSLQPMLTLQLVELEVKVEALDFLKEQSCVEALAQGLELVT